MPAPLPPGYERLEAPGVEGVARGPLVGPLLAALTRDTLYEYARQRADRREFVGRGPVYAISLDGIPLVVRRARHGGLLAPLTGDLFVGATRAPHELAVSTRLRAAGVATPEVMAYALYHAGPGLRRADIVTREVPDAADLLAILSSPTQGIARAAIWDAVRALVDDLDRLGAAHADLNVKNILLAPVSGGRPAAHVLDVDRVVWRRPGDTAVHRANWARLERSARKRGLL